MKGTSTERQKYIHHEHDTPCAVDEEGIKRDAESLKKLRAVMVRDNTLFASFVTFNKKELWTRKFVQCFVVMLTSCLTLTVFFSNVSFLVHSTSIAIDGDELNLFVAGCDVRIEQASDGKNEIIVEQNIVRTNFQQIFFEGNQVAFYNEYGCDVRNRKRCSDACLITVFVSKTASVKIVQEHAENLETVRVRNSKKIALERLTIEGDTVDVQLLSLQATALQVHTISGAISLRDCLIFQTGSLTSEKSNVYVVYSPSFQHRQNIAVNYSSVNEKFCGQVFGPSRSRSHFSSITEHCDISSEDSLRSLETIFNEDMDLHITEEEILNGLETLNKCTGYHCPFETDSKYAESIVGVEFSAEKILKNLISLNDSTLIPSCMKSVDVATPGAGSLLNVSLTLQSKEGEIRIIASGENYSEPTAPAYTKSSITKLSQAASYNEVLSASDIGANRGFKILKKDISELMYLEQLGRQHEMYAEIDVLQSPGAQGTRWVYSSRNLYNYIPVTLLRFVTLNLLHPKRDRVYVRFTSGHCKSVSKQSSSASVDKIDPFRAMETSWNKPPDSYARESAMLGSIFEQLEKSLLKGRPDTDSLPPGALTVVLNVSQDDGSHAFKRFSFQKDKFSGKYVPVPFSSEFKFFADAALFISFAVAIVLSMYASRGFYVLAQKYSHDYYIDIKTRKHALEKRFLRSRRRKFNHVGSRRASQQVLETSIIRSFQDSEKSQLDQRTSLAVDKHRKAQREQFNPFSHPFHLVHLFIMRQVTQYFTDSLSNFLSERCTFQKNQRSKRLFREKGDLNGFMEAYRHYCYEYDVREEYNIEHIQDQLTAYGATVDPHEIETIAGVQWKTEDSDLTVKDDHIEEDDVLRRFVKCKCNATGRQGHQIILNDFKNALGEWCENRGLPVPWVTESLLRNYSLNYQRKTIIMLKNVYVAEEGKDAVLVHHFIILQTLEVLLLLAVIYTLPLGIVLPLSWIQYEILSPAADTILTSRVDMTMWPFTFAYPAGLEEHYILAVVPVIVWFQVIYFFVLHLHLLLYIFKKTHSKFGKKLQSVVSMFVTGEINLLILYFSLVVSWFLLVSIIDPEKFLAAGTFVLSLNHTIYSTYASLQERAKTVVDQVHGSWIKATLDKLHAKGGFSSQRKDEAAVAGENTITLEKEASGLRHRNTSLIASFRANSSNAGKVSLRSISKPQRTNDIKLSTRRVARLLFKALCDTVDVSHEDSLDRHEFEKALDSIGIHLSLREVDKIFCHVDNNMSGDLSIGEFEISWLWLRDHITKKVLQGLNVTQEDIQFHCMFLFYVIIGEVLFLCSAIMAWGGQRSIFSTLVQAGTMFASGNFAEYLRPKSKVEVLSNEGIQKSVDHFVHAPHKK